MPLIVFKRRDRAKLEKCRKCPYCLEIRDDPERYPKTVAVVCSRRIECPESGLEFNWCLVR